MNLDSPFSSKVKANGSGTQGRLRELLEKLVLRASPDWSDWARGELIRITPR